MIQVHDFRLESGGERCSIVTGGHTTLVQVGEVTLTLEQLRELVRRVDEFDYEAEANDDGRE